MVKRNNYERDADHAREEKLLEEILLTKTADEWEKFFQDRHVPASRVRQMREAIADPHLATRGVIHRFPDGAPGIDGAFGVPLAAFKFAHGTPRIDTPPPRFGADTDTVLAELGYSAGEIAGFRAARVV